MCRYTLSELLTFHTVGDVAQLVERSLSMWEVPGSIPGFSKRFFPFPRPSELAQYARSKILILSHLATRILASYNWIHANPSGIRTRDPSHSNHHKNWHLPLKRVEPARIRTWNLLIRSQTRYPLRHRSRWRTPGISLLLLQEQVTDFLMFNSTKFFYLHVSS